MGPSKRLSEFEWRGITISLLQMTTLRYRILVYEESPSRKWNSGLSVFDSTVALTINFSPLCPQHPLCFFITAWEYWPHVPVPVHGREINKVGSTVPLSTPVLGNSKGKGNGKCYSLLYTVAEYLWLGSLSTTEVYFLQLWSMGSSRGRGHLWWGPSASSVRPWGKHEMTTLINALWAAAFGRGHARAGWICSCPDQGVWWKSCVCKEGEVFQT